MKRFHIHIGVQNLEKSIIFYSNVFGIKPSKVKEDYAKWMLEDPKINFAISTRSNKLGLDHLGIQVDDIQELTQLTEQLKNADLSIEDEGQTTCCYSESNKAWVNDPSGIAWEVYHTMADVGIFSENSKLVEAKNNACCPPKSKCC